MSAHIDPNSCIATDSDLETARLERISNGLCSHDCDCDQCLELAELEDFARECNRIRDEVAVERDRCGYN